MQQNSEVFHRLLLFAVAKQSSTLPQKMKKSGKRKVIIPVPESTGAADLSGAIDGMVAVQFGIRHIRQIMEPFSGGKTAIPCELFRSI
jgi:hypothetical protein